MLRAEWTSIPFQTRKSPIEITAQLIQDPCHETRYIVGPTIGQGGMARVNLGVDFIGKQHVAIKQALDDIHREKNVTILRNESRVHSTLKDPNIPRWIDFVPDPLNLLIIEYIAGCSLENLMAIKSYLSLTETVHITSIIAHTLDRQNLATDLVHRDINPGNIRLKDRDVKYPYLIDFGSVTLDSREVRANPRYQSPESITNPMQMDHRSDLYSLGIVTFELLTGCSPYGHFLDLTELLPRILSSSPPSLDNFSTTRNLPTKKRLDDFFKVALAKNPNDRFIRGSQFASSLISCI